MSLLYGAVLALGLATATLIPTHAQPNTVFASEWWVVWLLMLAVLAVSLAPGGVVRVCLGTPLWIGLLLSLTSAAWALAGGGLGYALYGALLIAAWVAGGIVLRDEAQGWLAWGLLTCAQLQSVAGVLQLADVNLDGMILRKMYLQAFGNVGQANHYADLIYLGMASLAWLWAGGRGRSLPAGRVNWPDAAFALLGAIMAVSAAFSASRAVWLYIVGFALLGGVGLKRGDVLGRRCGLALLVLAAISVLVQLAVAYSGILSHLGVVSSIERAGDVGSNGQRLYNWQAAWLAIQAHPWIGEGPGTFYKVSIDAMFRTPPAAFPKFAEHAHNLPLNLAAELGVPVAVALMLGLAWWFLRHLVAAGLSATRLWALAVVAVVGLHSMVEYPLWYAYFLVPFGLCMGVADAEDAGLPAVRLPRGVAVAMCVAGLAVLAWVMHDWLAVRYAYQMLNDEEPAVAPETREMALRRLEEVSRLSVFAQIAEGLRLQSWRPEDGDASMIAERCDRTWQYKPGWYLMMRCGEAYAIAGRESSLDRLARAGCDGFPRHREPLAAWARGFDAQGLAAVKVTGRACLK